MIDQGVVDKCRKLLSLRERAGTPAEATAAAGRLAALLEKHRMSEAQLEVDTGPRGDYTAEVDAPIVGWRKLKPWRLHLVRVLCDHYGVVWWERGMKDSRAAPGVRKRALHLCGRSDDVRIVRDMYAWLCSEAKPPAGLGRGAGDSWRLGFVAGIERQLVAVRAQTAAAAAAGNQCAMVLVGRKDAALDELKKRLGKPLEDTTNATPQVDIRAFRAGHATGAVFALEKRLQGGDHGS